MAIWTLQTMLTGCWHVRYPSLGQAIRTLWRSRIKAIALSIASLMLGSCAELVEFRTDIIHVRSDLQANTQALAQLSARVGELERRQADAESASRQTQQDLSQAIAVLLRKALITEDQQITRESARSQLRDSEIQETQADSPTAGGQRTSSRGENSPQGRKLLSLGMTQDAVRRMLGDPLSIEPVGPYVFWHYAPMSNQHYVIFDQRSGQVSGWRGP